MQADFAGALMQGQGLSAAVDAHAVYPGDRELDRYDALVLHVEDQAADLVWYHPEVLRKNTRPLLLAGEPKDIYSSGVLHGYADDVMMRPFSPGELVLRLCRITVGVADRGHTAASGVKPCVVVADDEPAIVIFVKGWLQNFDLDAHFVTDGRAAVYAARRLLPDLLLLDVDMPVMNGLEVLRSLRNDPRTSALTTVLLTASTEASDVKDGFDLGAVYYITKPFSYFDLTRKLRPLLKLDAGVSKHARSVDAIQPPKVPVLTTPGRRSQDRWTVLFG